MQLSAQDEIRRAAGAGALATAAMTALALPAEGLGLLRLDFGRLLGTAVLPDGKAARAVGWGLHALNGSAFALGYLAAFRWRRERPTAARGAALGAGHFAVSMLALALMPRIHPRPRQAGLRPLGPTTYGILTVPGMLTGHVLYGALVGARLGR